MQADCIFCKIINKEVKSDIILEDSNVIVIKDIAPKAEIHYLIIPKKHIKDISSLESGDCCLASKMILASKKLSQDIPGAQNFRLISNNGFQAGQRVFHLHFHFIAGKLLPEF